MINFITHRYQYLSESCKVLATNFSENAKNADNQQGSPLRELRMTPQRLHAGHPNFNKFVKKGDDIV